MRHGFWLLGLAGFLLTAAPTVYADGLTNMQRILNAGDSPAAAKDVGKASTQTSGIQSMTKTQDPDAIRLTPDRTKILRLREDAASVIVANPTHASVVLDSPRLLILMPRTPGTTAFTVMNAQGQVLLERSIIVSATQPKYVRVRRICSGNNRDCAPSTYHYCPDGCYDVTPVAPDSRSNIPPVIGGSALPPGPDMIEEEMEGPMIDEGPSQDVPDTEQFIEIPEMQTPEVIEMREGQQ